MKKKLSLILMIVLILSVFLVGCSNAAENNSSTDEASQTVTSDKVDKTEPSADNEKNKIEKAEESDSDKTKVTKDEKSEEAEKADKDSKDAKNSKDTKSDTTEKTTKNNETKKPSSTNKNNTTKPVEKNENVNTAPSNNVTKVEDPPVKNEDEDTQISPAETDKMNWPDNEYTKLVPKPSRGVVRKADKQDGIYCILMTGADMVDAKTYAANLINCGFTRDVTETIETETYLFGGGNSSGTFVVVSYQNGQFIVGIER